jgi:hypothetical protein
MRRLDAYARGTIDRGRRQALQNFQAALVSSEFARLADDVPQVSFTLYLHVATQEEGREEFIPAALACPIAQLGEAAALDYHASKIGRGAGWHARVSVD